MAKGRRFTDAEKKAIASEAGGGEEIAKRHDIHFTTVSKWRRKFKKPVAKQMAKKKPQPADIKLEEVKEFLDLKRELAYWQRKYLQLIRETDS